jgi:hypothetical protein
VSAWTTGWRGSTWWGEAAQAGPDRRAPEQSAAEGAAESRLSGRTAPLARAQVLSCVQRGILLMRLGARVVCGGSELGVQRDCGLSAVVGPFSHGVL